MLSLLIWVPVLSFAAQDHFSEVLAAGGGTRAWVCIQLFSVVPWQALMEGWGIGQF